MDSTAIFKSGCRRASGLSWWLRVKGQSSLCHTRTAGMVLHSLLGPPLPHLSADTTPASVRPSSPPKVHSSRCCHQGKQTSGLTWTQISTDGPWGQDPGADDEFPGGAIWTSVIRFFTMSSHPTRFLFWSLKGLQQHPSPVLLKLQSFACLYNFCHVCVLLVLFVIYLIILFELPLFFFFFFFLLKYIFNENFKSLLYPSIEQSHSQEFIWKIHLQRYKNAHLQGYSVHCYL